MKALRYAALGLAAPLLLGHGTAGAHTLGLSVSPYKIISSQHNVSVPVVVTNLSGGRVKVTSSAISESRAGRGCKPGAAPPWITVTPAHLTLARGARIRTHVILHAPASATGNYDLIAVYRARAAAIHKTGLSASAGVGARVLVSYGGGGAPAPCVASVPATVRHGINLLAWAAVAAGVLVLLLAAWALILRRRRYSHT